MPPIKCYFLEPAGTIRQSLRRYSKGNTLDCCPNNPGQYSYHNAMAHLADVPETRDAQGYILPADDRPADEDPRWPLTCACGYQFTPDDHWQVFQDPIYRRSDTGEMIPLRDAPAGAMWYADWLLPRCSGPDGHVLIVKTPGGDWVVDDRASNCTKPEDKEHRCWVRHGVPPEITVDKNGNTCSAGAGSIQAGRYHGFLRGGYLVDS